MAHASSDYDLGDAPPARYGGLGKRSIAAMQENAARDRLESKKTSRHLQLTHKDPQTEYHMYLWHARLTAFRLHTLNIERFLTTLVSYLKPHGGVPSLRSLKKGFESIVGASTFYYSDFRLTAHDHSRIESTLQTLLLQGKLTTNVARERRWIGAFVVQKIIDAAYRDDLDNSVLSWDLALTKIQAIVLLAALGCRAGDITQGRFDRHELPFLTYGDPTIKLVGGSSVEHLIMLVRMRNEKGRKNDPLQDSSKIFTGLSDTLIRCPIKTIVVMALRTGNVHGAMTLETMLSTTAQRADKTVQWEVSDWPVLPSLTGGGVVRPGEAASKGQIGPVLQEAAHRAGIALIVRPHDIRRCAAKDIANVEVNGYRATAVGDAQLLLGHTHTSLHRGVTKQYVGDGDHDLWRPRVEAQYQDPFQAPVMYTEDVAPRRKRPYTSKEVDSFCATYGLNPKIRRDRGKATRYANKDRRKAQLQNIRDVHDFRAVWIADTGFASNE